MAPTSISTEWPSFAPAPVKTLVTKFFATLDNQGSESGNVLADEIFAGDADAYFGPQHFHGTDQIRKSRDNAWSAVSFRRHSLVKVYAGDETCDDLMFLGRAEISLRNGNKVDQEITGRLKIKEPKSQNPKVLLFQVWADSAPVIAAMKTG